MTYDITIVLNAHNEGNLLGPTIASLNKARIHAQKSGLSTEVIAVVDNASLETIRYLKDNRLPDSRVYQVSFGDPGLSRNCGVNEAKGNYVAFLDGDDLWGENWLTACHQASKDDPRRIIWHPEVNIYYPLNQRLFRHIDMESPEFDLLSLSMANYWTSLSFSIRTTYQEVPFRRTDLQNQVGHEDWAWNCEVITRGLIHKVVPLTAHAIRTKRSSQLLKANQMKVMTHPTPLFLDYLKTQNGVAHA